MEYLFIFIMFLGACTVVGDSLDFSNLRNLLGLLSAIGTIVWFKKAWKQMQTLSTDPKPMPQKTFWAYTVSLVLICTGKDLIAPLRNSDDLQSSFIWYWVNRAGSFLLLTLGAFLIMLFMIRCIEQRVSAQRQLEIGESKLKWRDILKSPEFWGINALIVAFLLVIPFRGQKIHFVSTIRAAILFYLMITGALGYFDKIPFRITDVLAFLKKK